MQKIPTAILSKDLVKRFLIDPTFEAAKAGQSYDKGGKKPIDSEKSAFALYANHLHAPPFMETTYTLSLFIVVVNQLAQPLTLAIDPPGTDLYYGSLEAWPTYVIYDKHRGHYVETGPDYEIPAGSTADKTVGLGVLAMVQGDLLHGTGGAFSVTSKDENLENLVAVSGCRDG